MKYTMIELFGGIGAPRKAIENRKLPIKTIDYVDFDDKATLAYNVIYNENYPTKNILEWTPSKEVDIVFHGSPCQDFSIAGKKDMSKGRSILYQRTLDLIGNYFSTKPKIVVWENVKGLVGKKNFHYFKHYLDTMESFGYKNYYKVLNSLDFGIPQRRERVFVISIRNDIEGEFNFDNLANKKTKSLIDFLEQETLQKWKTADVFKETPNYFIIPRVKDNLLISGSYNRMWKVDKHVGTITASSFLKIGSQSDDALKYRTLTPKESWRLMGFTDQDFEKVLNTKQPKTTLYKLAGNSIVVNVLEEIFSEIVKVLEKN